MGLAQARPNYVHHTTPHHYTTHYHVHLILPAHDNNMVFSLVTQVATATPSLLSSVTEIAGGKSTYLVERGEREGEGKGGWEREKEDGEGEREGGWGGREGRRMRRWRERETYNVLNFDDIIIAVSLSLCNHSLCV